MTKPASQKWVKELLKLPRKDLLNLLELLNLTKAYSSHNGSYLKGIPVSHFSRLTKSEIERQVGLLGEIQNRLFPEKETFLISDIVEPRVSIKYKNKQEYIEGLWGIPITEIAQQIGNYLTGAGSVKPDTQIIDFDKESGLGYAKKSFKLKNNGPEYRVFSELYSRINKAVDRYSILTLIGFYSPKERPNPERKESETYAINEIAKSLRKKTGLTTKELVLNNGNLTLLGKKTTILPQIEPK